MNQIAGKKRIIKGEYKHIDKQKALDSKIKFVKDKMGSDEQIDEVQPLKSTKADKKHRMHAKELMYLITIYMELEPHAK